MPKQFRLKIALWAIFFFFTHPQKAFVCQQDLCSLSVFTPWRVDTIGKVAGLVWDIQNSKSRLMELSSLTAKCPEKNRIKELSMHRIISNRLSFPLLSYKYAQFFGHNKSDLYIEFTSTLTILTTECLLCMRCFSKNFRGINLLICTTLGGRYDYLNFTFEKPQVQGDEVTCPGSLS